MERHRAWVLNLDADDELASPRGYAPSAATLARLETFARRAHGLVPAGDAVVATAESAGPRGSRRAAPRSLAPGFGRHTDHPALQEAGPGRHRSRTGTTENTPPLGLAWCPTPSAIRRLVAHGATPLPAPDLAILRRVNHRRFCAELGQTLPLARYVGTRAELDVALALAEPGTSWVLKRPFGFVGRGRRMVRAAGLTTADDAWVEASLRGGEGLQAEPWVQRSADFAVHGYVAPGGAVVLGVPTIQRCDARGAWQESARAGPGDLTGDERGALLAEAARVATALDSAGYFGPFGIDAFRWSDARGTVTLDPRCEINARYSMGWAIGMGEVRPDLDPPR
jgi:hypothetical protein